ncbi:T-cell surface glycoprotein CD8 alpha chain isoform X2 [Hyla sarda]|uniref:T-cell surface glycoprotein CD8 alpha chain isoform X2 n=1 Tax=Hyla sarda TaxID=327740 RepID=UPI0024C40168|nr:T-cell surface glycoprotein CD8 alpha chain isoform X2 [Hyla sarda]
MVSHTMFTISSLTILLCLFLCTHQLRITSNPLQRGSSRSVKIECLLDTGESKDYGVFWFRHKKGATSPESIVHLSSTGRETYRDSNQDFKAEISGFHFTLTTNKFGEKDQGTYYCMINKNSVLYISPGLQLIYPEVTSPKPKLTKPPPARTTDAGDPCNCPPANKDPEPLGLSCDQYVWAPLAGLCGVFLICLLITSIMLCCRTRRRRCRCKPRSMEENNGNLIAQKRQI